MSLKCEICNDEIISGDGVCDNCYKSPCDQCRSQIEADKERETRQKCWEDYRWAYDGGCDDEPEAYKYLKQKWGIVK